MVQLQGRLQGNIGNNPFEPFGFQRVDQGPWIEAQAVIEGIIIGLDIIIGRGEDAYEISLVCKLGKYKVIELLNTVMVQIYPGILSGPCGNLKIGLGLLLLLSRPHLEECIAR